MEDGRLELAQQHLQDFLDQNPDHPNALRYLIDFELKHSKDDYRWVSLSQKLLSIDPLHASSSLIQELIDFYDTQSRLDADDEDSKDFTMTSEDWLLRIVELLARRLDFDIGEPWMWLQLIETIGKLRDASSGLDFEVWSDRKDWWPRLHFSKPRQTYPSDQGTSNA